MTATFATMLSNERPSRWNVLFAEESDKDLDFDEGFEEDDLHQSKPPSRRPLLWIVLLVLVGCVAYWTLNNQAPPMQRTAVIESMEDNTFVSKEEGLVIPSPLFREEQTVVLIEQTGVSMLMGDPTNSQPGPIVKGGEPLTILDGTHQKTGWVYQLQTASGKTGWISEEKLKKPS